MITLMLAALVARFFPDPRDVELERLRSEIAELTAKSDFR
jgi:hypothetical protein